MLWCVLVFEEVCILSPSPGAISLSNRTSASGFGLCFLGLLEHHIHFIVFTRHDMSSAVYNISENISYTKKGVE